MAQKNKKQKPRHKSKRSRKQESGGRLDKQFNVGSKAIAQSKASRRNKTSQKRHNNKQKLLESRRSNAPRVTGIVPLSENIDTRETLVWLTQGNMDSIEEGELNFHEPITYESTPITFVACDTSLQDILDVSLYCDVILFAVDATEGQDAFGKQVQQMLEHTGVSIAMICLLNMHTIPKKQHAQMRKDALGIIDSSFAGKLRVFTQPPIDEFPTQLSDFRSFHRFVTEQRVVEPLAWREERGYLVGHEVEYEPDEEDVGFGTLQVSGFVRGAPITANNPVHLMGYGDYAIKSIEVVPAPFGSKKTKEERVYEPEEEVDMTAFYDVDLLNQEQTWPTADEILRAEKEQKEMKARFIYGDERLDKSDDEEEEEFEDEETLKKRREMMELEEELMDAYADSDFEPEEDEGKEDLKEWELALQSQVDYAQRSLLESAPQMEKRSHEDLEWPDEVDTPLDARLKFCQYRGLESFRHSRWDPSDDRPTDYQRIFEFDDFSQARLHTLKASMFNPIEVGSFVVVTIEKVPAIETWPIMFFLNPHEHRWSVIHVNMKLHDEVVDSIELGSSFSLQMGFRRFNIKPVISETVRNCRKRKLARFMHPGKDYQFTFYAPISFSQVPVMTFDEEGIQAFGTFHDVNPDALVIERVIFTGYPYRMKKRTIGIRMMFWKAEDIKFFKSVNLWTKDGAQGRISSSIGLYGRFKAMFDRPVNANDTICMSIYKRSFPKWEDTEQVLIKEPRVVIGNHDERERIVVEDRYEEYDMMMDME
ncbi:hypothetical protein PCE1_002600 [Barthelona sp. PCE]